MQQQTSQIYLIHRDENTKSSSILPAAAACFSAINKMIKPQQQQQGAQAEKQGRSMKNLSKYQMCTPDINPLPREIYSPVVATIRFICISCGL